MISEKRKRYLKAYRKKNREKIRISWRKYYRDNKHKAPSLLKRTLYRKNITIDTDRKDNASVGRKYELIALKFFKGSEDMNRESFHGGYDMEWYGKKIEVKCSSYLQDWDQQDLSKPLFSGLKAKELYYNDVVGKKSDKKADYKSDIYVLCLFQHKETETLDILNLDQWSFYALSRKRLKEISNDGSSISLVKLNKQNIVSISFEELRETVDKL